jgi:hypothetical protein
MCWEIEAKPKRKRKGHSEIASGELAGDQPTRVEGGTVTAILGRGGSEIFAAKTCVFLCGNHTDLV